MRRIFIYTAIVFLLINTAAGILLSSYDSFNWVLADITIVFSVLLRMVFNKSSASDGMKISFNFILSFFEFCSFILAVIMNPYFIDNLLFICFLVVISIQLLIVILPKNFTKISK